MSVQFQGGVQQSAQQHSHHVEAELYAAAEAGAEEAVQDKQRRLQKTERARQKKDSSLVSRLMSSDSESAKREMMDGAVKGAAQLKKGLKQDGALSEKINQELSRLFEGESQEDMPTLSDAAMDVMSQEEEMARKNRMRRARAKQMKRGLLGDSEAADAEPRRFEASKSQAAEALRKSRKAKQRQSQITKSDLKSFSSAYASYVSNQSPAQKQKLEQMKRMMRDKGLSAKQISGMEDNVGRAVRQHYVASLKSSLLKHYFSEGESRLDAIASVSGYTEEAKGLERRQDQGMLRGGLHDVMDKMGAELRRDMEGFLFEEMSSRFVELSLGQKSAEEYGQELEKLLKVASSAGVVINQEELNEKLRQSIDDLGLEEFIAPDQLTVSAMDTQSGGSDQRQDEAPVYINQEAMLEDQLRHLYMLKAMGATMGMQVEIRFKMRRLKNGLIKLGVDASAKMKQLSEQGQFLARTQLLSQLKDTYREQATLERLLGPAYDVIKKRRASILKQLRRMGYRLTVDHLEKMRDDANVEVYPVISEQYKQTEALLEVNRSRSLVQRFRSLSKVLSRLREETRIVESNQEEDSILLGERKVNEAA